MLWPRPSTVFTKPRSSIGAGSGGRSMPSSSRRWNGSTGSTIAGLLEPIGNIPPAEAEEHYYAKHSSLTDRTQRSA